MTPGWGVGGAHSIVIQGYSRISQDAQCKAPLDQNVISGGYIKVLRTSALTGTGLGSRDTLRGGGGAVSSPALSLKSPHNLGQIASPAVHL